MVGLGALEGKPLMHGRRNEPNGPIGTLRSRLPYQKNMQRDTRRLSISIFQSLKLLENGVS